MHSKEKKVITFVFFVLLIAFRFCPKLDKSFKIDNDKINALKEENQQLQREKSDLQEKNQRLEKDKSDLQEKNQRLEKDKSDLQEKNQQIKKDIQTAENKCQDIMESFISINGKMDEPIDGIHHNFKRQPCTMHAILIILRS